MLRMMMWMLVCLPLATVGLRGLRVLGVEGAQNDTVRDTAVFTFGRFNPPHVGHQQLLQKVKEIAGEKRGDAYIFGSHSHDQAKNPLPHAAKMKYLAEMFPNEMGIQKATPGISKTMRTPIDVAMHLKNTYKHLVMVVGSDRVDGFEKLLNTYNGRPGMWNYASIKVVRAGVRDPYADDVAGMSASKMRAAAVDEKQEVFAKGCPKEYDCSALYNAVREGMKTAPKNQPKKSANRPKNKQEGKAQEDSQKEAPKSKKRRRSSRQEEEPKSKKRRRS